MMTNWDVLLLATIQYLIIFMLFKGEYSLFKKVFQYRMLTLELMKVTNLPSSSSPCRARDEWVKAKAVTMGPNNFWKCDLKSVNLQYNKLVRWAEEKNDSSTKHLMFQVLFFFIICHRHRHHVGLGMSEWKRRPSQWGQIIFENVIWNPSIYNIISWFAGLKRKMTRRPSIWCSKYYFFS